MIPIDSKDEKFLQDVKKRLKDKTAIKMECPRCGGTGSISSNIDYGLHGIVLDCCPVCLGNKFIFFCKPDK